MFRCSSQNALRSNISASHSLNLAGISVYHDHATMCQTLLWISWRHLVLKTRHPFDFSFPLLPPWLRNPVDSSINFCSASIDDASHRQSDGRGRGRTRCCLQKICRILWLAEFLLCVQYRYLLCWVRLGCCLVSFHFLWDILWPHTVNPNLKFLIKYASLLHGPWNMVLLLWY